MRTITSAQDAALLGNGLRAHIKVEVRDAGAVWRDLSVYPEFDAVDEVAWGEDQDSPHLTADVTLFREKDGYSLAPLMATSPINTGFVPGGSYVPLLALNRELRVSVALTAADGAAQSGDYLLVFHGVIDSIDVAAGEERIRLGCRDLGGRLMSAWVKKERVYAFAAVGGASVSCRIFEPNSAFALNDYVIPTQGKLNGHFYKVTTAGTTASGENAEPAWTTAGGGTSTSGGVTFTEQGATTTAGRPLEEVLQNIINDWAPGTTLRVLSALGGSTTGFSVTQFRLDRGPVLEALRRLALVTIGWDVRQRWWPATSAFELVLLEPDRAKTAVDRTFDSSRFAAPGELSKSIAEIRNSVTVVYSDASDAWPDGTPKRKEVTRTDSASITAYGEQWMELAESDTSLIDSTTEAQALADAALFDLREPLLSASFAILQGFPHAQLGDLYRFTGDGRHFSADQDMAVFGVRHTARGGELVTELSLRGKPSVGVARWHRLDTRLQRADSHSLQIFEAAGGVTMTASSVVGGTRLSVALAPERLAHGEEFEFHLSETQGFVPGPSSFVGLSKSREWVAPHLLPGRTYYARAVPRTRNLGRVVRGLASPELSFVAGRASTGHLASGMGWSEVPLNGDFESRLDAAGMPDHWTISGVGTFNTNYFVNTDANGISGAKYMRMVTPASGDVAIKSAPFPVADGWTHRFEAWAKKVAGTGTTFFIVSINYLDKDLAAVSSANALVVDLDAMATVWTRYQMALPPAPSGARFATLECTILNGGGGAANREVHFDRIRALSVLAAGARASRSSNQSISSATDTIVDFSTVDSDPLGAVTTGASWKFTVPTGCAGKYRVSALVTLDFAGYDGAIIFQTRVFVNGTGNRVLDRFDMDVTNLDSHSCAGSTTVDLADADFIDVRVFQDSGASKNTNASVSYVHVEIERVSD